MIAVACAGRAQRDVVAAQEDHHGVERDALVAVDKGVVAGKAERIGCGERSHIRLSVMPLVDWPQDRQLEKATIPNAFRSAEYRQLLGMHVDDFIDIEPNWLTHFASAANVSRYSCMTLRAISMVRACLGLNGESRKLPSGCSTG